MVFLWFGIAVIKLVGLLAVMFAPLLVDSSSSHVCWSSCHHVSIISLADKALWHVTA